MAAQDITGNQSTIVRRFLAWARVADADRRADAANALARAYLHSEFDAQTRREAELGLFALLDDPSSHVRRALAEGLAGGAAAPPAMILALAADEPNVAAIVLARSPVLTESDLVDCAATGDVTAQIAIAERPALGVAVSAALAEIGAREAVAALLGNPSAEIAPLSLARIAERFVDDADLCERLCARADLPPAVRHDLVAGVAARLSAFVAERGWLSQERAGRIALESRERAILHISDESAPNARTALVRHLRARAALTPALLLRSALTGDVSFASAALAELSGAPATRVAALIRQPKSGAFAALCERAGMSSIVSYGLASCLAAAAGHLSGESGAMARSAVEAALIDVARAPIPGAGDMAALLRRFAAEAAREEARHFVETSRAELERSEAPAHPALVFTPANLDMPQTILMDDEEDLEPEVIDGMVLAELGAAALPVVDWPGDEGEALAAHEAEPMSEAA